MPHFKNKVHTLTALPPEFEIAEGDQGACQSQKWDKLHGMTVPEISDRQQYSSEHRINPSYDQSNGDSQQSQKE